MRAEMKRKFQYNEEKRTSETPRYKDQIGEYTN